MNEQLILAPASKKQELFLNSDTTITLGGGSAGGGKALRHGEKVLTPYGFQNIESMKIGDRIVTPKNTIEEITGVYPQGVVDIYRVTFQDGSSVDTCGDHLWKWRKSGKKEYEVSSTLDILSWMNAQKPDRLYNCKRKPMVDLIQPVEYGKKSNLPIDPYTLGVLLGDGSITTTSVSFITEDEEITDRIKSSGWTLNRWRTNENKTKAKTYGILGIQSSLRQLNLLGCNSLTKFIPDQYLTSSIQDRFDLIQGLMDTDGYVDPSGSTEFCTISPLLRDGITLILRSLGFTVTCSEKLPFYKDKNGNRIYGQKAYNLYIRGRNQPRLFSISRKIVRTKYKNVSNAIISIEKVDRDFATCISISGEDKLFITTNFIPTHNTYTALLIALKFMQYPRATGVIFRRTSKMITAPGSIWHEAVSMYSSIYKTGLKIRHRENEIVFPNGSLLKFSHMQHASNMYDHKGGQYSLVIFDEATDFSEDMIVYLLSRMRNAYTGHSPQMFLMTNPDYNSFLREWIQDFYLDPISGIPIEDKSGAKRYFFRQGNTMLWYNSLQEAESVHGSGSGSGISSFTFLPFTCRDNPPLLKAQPDYVSRLMSLPRVEMERLLLGSWFARPESSGLFKREWVTLVDHPNGRARQRVRAWDFAFSQPSEQYPNPDWTRGVLMSKDGSNVYTIEDCVGLRDRVHVVERLLFETAIRDGRDVVISIPQDPNAAAGAYAKDLQRRLGEMGFTCRLQRPVKSKITRFAPFSSVAQAGFVNVVKADWNKEYFDELEVFDGSGKYKDDQTDATSDCFSLLNRDIVLPTFSLPSDLTNSNPLQNFTSGISLPSSGLSLPRT